MRAKSKKLSAARGFARCEKGVTAVEFAFVGPIFFAMIAATIETGLVFFAGAALDSAVLDSSRLLRTGQAAYRTSEDNFREALCGNLYGIFDCDEVRIAVRKLDDFNAFAMSQPIDPATGNWTLSGGFQPGIGSETVMIEAYYKWPTFFNIPQFNAGQTADGKRLLASAHVYRNEPF